ncbi:HIT family protein [Alkalicoccobacillus gibsonii]|uniref:HIT family protein n=1 Tax=Alkalicoccobacillus gibsonii TaxID=79881 RepID=UPI003511430A
MEDSGCVFCDIVHKRADSYMITQNEYTTTFLDSSPIAEGHMLVVPNKHVITVDQLDNREAANELMQSIIGAAHLLVKAGVCPDYSILQDNGEHAEQDIKHVHFHIIPRHANDHVHFNLQTNSNAQQEEMMRNIYNKLKTTNGGL